MIKHAYLAFALFFFLSVPELPATNSIDNADFFGQDIQQVLDNYRKTQGNWFSAANRLNLEIDGKEYTLPNFLWLANLIPPRLGETNVYQICQLCFLHKDSYPDKKYLQEKETWHQEVASHIGEWRKFLHADYWRLAKHKAEAFLSQMYRERGALATIIVALTWIPYTAITEGVIEPMLIGPLHAICPIFQVIYFGTLNFTHILYQNVRHMAEFAAEDISFRTRFKLAAAFWKHLPKGQWKIKGHTTTAAAINNAMVNSHGDNLIAHTLRSPLSPVIAANILSEPTTPTDISTKDQETVYLELTHPQKMRRIYFVDSVINVANTLVDLVAINLNYRLEKGDLDTSLYKDLRGQLGYVKKGILELELCLRKMITAPAVIADSHTDLAYVNFHLLAKITTQSLVLLMDTLTALHKNQENYETVSIDFRQKVSELAEANLVVGVSNLSKEQR